MGFCVFNNVAIAAEHVLRSGAAGVQRVAVVDWDVHHGNGTESIFEDRADVLVVSIHQAQNYPLDTGYAKDMGRGDGLGSNVNVPLPPGCGSGAYEYTFEKVVAPAVRRHRPDLILVSCGFDASYADPLSAMMLSSEAFRAMARSVVGLAGELCGGRLVLVHEGGYSENYVPFCGAAVIEELCGVRETEHVMSDDERRAAIQARRTDPISAAAEAKYLRIEDPYLSEVRSWGYQDLQDHQKAVVDEVCRLHALP